MSTATFTAPDAPGITVEVTEHTTGAYSAQAYVDGQLALTGARVAFPSGREHHDPFALRAHQIAVALHDRTDPNQPNPKDPVWNMWNHRVDDRAHRMVEYLAGSE